MLCHIIVVHSLESTLISSDRVERVIHLVGNRVLASVETGVDPLVRL